MKILISLSYYLPNVSGLTLYVKNLAEVFIQEKHDVTIFTSQFNKKLPQHEKVDDMTIIRVPVFLKFGKALFMPLYPFFAYLAVRKSDVVFINLPQFESCILVLLAKMLRKKIYCIYHCEVTLPRGIHNLITEYVLHGIHFFSLLFSDRIITYTEDYAKHSKLLPLFKNKTRFTYPLIKEPTIDSQILTNIKGHIPQGKKYIIGIAARVSAEKGIEFLFQAIPELQKKLYDRFFILIAGPKQPVGEEAYIQRMKPLIKKYKEFIYFLDTIPYKQLGSFYSLLDILVLPSINSTEAFGIVQVEAMLSGVPVVASDLPGVRIPVQKTGMGKIVPLKKSQAITEAIIEIIENKNKFMKNKGKIQNEFSYQKTVDFYNALLCS